MCEIYAYSGEVNKTFNDELREFWPFRRQRAITCVSACGSIWKGPQLSHTFVMRRSAL